MASSTCWESQEAERRSFGFHTETSRSRYTLYHITVQKSAYWFADGCCCSSKNRVVWFKPACEGEWRTAVMQNLLKHNVGPLGGSVLRWPPQLWAVNDQPSGYLELRSYYMKRSTCSVTLVPTKDTKDECVLFVERRNSWRTRCNECASHYRREIRKTEESAFYF